MGEQRIGVHIAEPDSRKALESIKSAEAMGISAAWMTTGGAGLDALTLFSAAAAQTERILLGTSIVPTFPRHPIAMVQQVQVIAQLAPGRFRLGVGPSHRPTMVDSFGVNFRSPLGHLREYVHIPEVPAALRLCGLRGTLLPGQGRNRRTRRRPRDGVGVAGRFL